MHTAKFAQFDVAGWNSLAGANDDGPAFGRFDCCPGHHPAVGQPVELLKGFHCSDPKFLGTTPDAETSDCTCRRGIGKWHDCRIKRSAERRVVKECVSTCRSR